MYEVGTVPSSIAFIQMFVKSRLLVPHFRGKVSLSLSLSLSLAHECGSIISLVLLLKTEKYANSDI
jgi:hypothetical protein